MKRAAEDNVRKLLEYFPIVAVLGVRQCGKTTLVRSITKSDEWSFYDLEKNEDYDLITNDPDLFFKLNNGKIAIDEAQLSPKLFSALRVAVDNSRSPGRFLITGSSSPELLKHVSESLAGRIATVNLSPFTFAEYSNSVDTNLVRCIKERRLLSEWKEELKAHGDEKALFKYWYTGGYPEQLIKNDVGFRELWFDNYISTYLNRDLASLFQGLNKERYRLFLKLLASQSGNIINLAECARSLDVSIPTIKDYFRIAEGTFIWRNLPAWAPQTTKRLVKHPKGYLRDSGLLHHQLYMNDLEHLMVSPIGGHSFEGMVIEQILRQFDFSSISYEAFHYRTSNGMEVDLILKGIFGKIAVEIKMGSTIKKKNISNLAKFIDQFDMDYGIVFNNSSDVVMLSEKILLVPVRMI